MSKKFKAVQGSDGYVYPITHTNLVVDNDGKTLNSILEDIGTELDEHSINIESNTNRLDIAEENIEELKSKTDEYDLDLKCLFSDSKDGTVVIESNSNPIYEKNSRDGYTILEKISGNTLLNYNKDTDKELVLMDEINVKSDSSVTINTAEGGLVDVFLEGNTLVNVSRTKELTPITSESSYTGGNHIPLKADGSIKPIVSGNTMVNLCTQDSPVCVTKAYTSELSNTAYFQEDCECKNRPIVHGNTIVNLAKYSNIEELGYYNELSPVVADNLLKPSTIYTAIYDVAATGRSCINVYVNGNKISSSPYYDNPKYKRDAIVFTTSEDPTNTVVFAQSDYKISLENVMIIKGNLNKNSVSGHIEGMLSCFEDNKVTQSMVESGEESVSNLGKYKVEYKTSKDNASFAGGIEEYTINGPESLTLKLSPINGWSSICIPTLNPYKTYSLEYEFITTNSSNSDCLKTRICGYKDGKELYITTLKTPVYIEFSGYDEVRVQFFSDSVNENIINITNFKMSDEDILSIFNANSETSKTLYLSSPLLYGDSIEEIGNSIYHVHRSSTRSYSEGDEFKYKTDMVKTVIPKDKPVYEMIAQNDSLLCDVRVGGKLTLNTVVPATKIEFKSAILDNIYLNKSTKYIVQFVSDNNKSASIALGGYELSNVNINVGMNKVVITTPNIVKDNNLIFDGYGFNIDKVVVTPFTEQSFGYFKGMLSSFEDSLVNGRYEVKYVVSDHEGRRKFTKTIYLNNPLLKDDTIEEIGENLVHVRRSELQDYVDGDENEYVTDLVKTLKQKDTPTYEVVSSDENSITIISYKNGYLDFSSSVPISGIKFLRFEEELLYLYPSTLYTVQFESDSSAEADIMLGGAILESQNIKTGTNRFAIITPATLDNNKLIIDGDGASIEKVVVTDSNKNFGYFEGMVSTGECENNQISIMSANIDNSSYNTKTINCEPLRSTKYKRDMFVYNEGCWFIERNCAVREYEYGDVNSDCKTDMVNTVYPLLSPTYEPIEYGPIPTYDGYTTISIDSAIQGDFIIRNHGFNCILKPNTLYTVLSNQKPKLIETSETVDNYLRIYGSGLIKNVIIVEGDYSNQILPVSSFTGMASCFSQDIVDNEEDENYGKYKVIISIANTDNSKVSSTEFYISDTLKGTVYYRDEIYSLDDKVIHEKKCQENILCNNADEVWNVVDLNDDSQVLCFSLSLSEDVAIKEDSYILCDRFSFLDNDTTNKEGVYIGEPNKLYFQIHKSKLTSYDLDGFKSWLQSNPTNILYQLSESICEEIDYNNKMIILESFKDSILSHNSNIPSLISIRYTFTVPAIDTLNETSDTQDIAIASLSYEQAMQIINSK